MTLKQFEGIFAEMGLPEPFIYVWYEEGEPHEVAGLITGWIRRDHGHPYLDVESLIVRPGVRRKFRVMMDMSDFATDAAFGEGCAYIVLSVREDDPRRAGLAAWAKRMNYQPYATQDGSAWYVRFNPTYVYQPQESSNGQGRFASEAGSTSTPAGS